MVDTTVLDASAAVDLLTGGRNAQRVEDALRGSTLTAPAHLDIEVLSALGRLWRADALPDTCVDEALEFLELAPIHRFPLAPLLRRSWRLRPNVALRDAPYVLIAADLKARLVTGDRRLARACLDHGLCRVHDLGND